ncbi:MAG: hypothetical protein AB1633_12385 [Elusimicrobiota bacterium]
MVTEFGIIEPFRDEYQKMNLMEFYVNLFKSVNIKKWFWYKDFGEDVKAMYAGIDLKTGLLDKENTVTDSQGEIWYLRTSLGDKYLELAGLLRPVAVDYRYLLKMK